MFTLLVIIFDVVALVWSGARIVKRSKEINYSSGRCLGWGLILVGIAIFSYGVRSVVIQFGESFYWIDELIFYRPAVAIHSIGLFLAFLFAYKDFVENSLAKLTAIPVLGSMFYLVYIFLFQPVNRKVVEQAPLEPIKFAMTNYPFASPLVSQIFLFITIGAPLIILGIFLYNAMKKNAAKALFYGAAIPVLGFFGLVGMWKPAYLPLSFSGGIYLGMFLLSLILILAAIFIEKEKRILIKALLYGLGISFQGLFIPICIFISPIFARLGYGVGAIMVYKAFGMKVD